MPIKELAATDKEEGRATELENPLHLIEDETHKNFEAIKQIQQRR